MLREDLIRPGQFTAAESPSRQPEIARESTQMVDNLERLSKLIEECDAAVRNVAQRFSTVIDSRTRPSGVEGGKAARGEQEKEVRSCEAATMLYDRNVTLIEMASRVSRITEFAADIVERCEL